MLEHTAVAVRGEPEPGHPAVPQTAPELSVLVPTRNEAGNIEELLRRLAAAVAGVPTEVIFIDDSDDLTPEVIRSVARRGGGGACRVSLIHRQGARRAGGLAGAVVDGLRAARGPWACVLDADLQHPPRSSPGCSSERSATGPTSWWPAATVRRAVPTASGRSAR